jgi:hypothetical protein
MRRVQQGERNWCGAPTQTKLFVFFSICYQQSS